MLNKWSVALVCLLCQAFGMGLVSSFSFFINPLVAEFDTNVATVNLGFVLLILVSASFSPLVGAMADRIAIKRVMLCGALLGGGGFVTMAFAMSLTTLAAAFVVFVLGMVCYGQLVTNALLIRFYHAERGRALAIAAVGVSLSSMILPIVLVSLIDVQGWRGASSSLGYAMIIVLFISIMIWVPAQLAKTNEDANDNNNDGAVGEALKPTTRWYLKCREFWVIGIGFAIIYSMAAVLALCYGPHFNSIGIATEHAALLVGLSGAGGLAGKIGFGIFVSHLRERMKFFLVALTLIHFFGWLLLAFGNDLTMNIFAVLCLGVSAGAFIPILPFLNSLYFPADIIGELSGFQVPLLLPLGLSGPPLAGWAYDTSGSYFWVFMVMAALTIVVIFMFLTLRKPLMNE